MHRKTPVLESFKKKKQLQAACSFITKGTAAQVFSCKSCEFFKNIYFEELEKWKELEKNF